jgi:NDP-sugar pyrophosphorylase family protein|nr:glycosyltransferase family 2 protein [uncultured Acetatifactor sp.]
MINVLLPAMGTSAFFKDAYFPKPLTEINGKTMLEMVVDNYRALEPKNYIFVLNDEDCKKFHIDASIRILTPASQVIKLHNQTAGALCTCLMAIDYINDDFPLIIANSDQIIDVDYGNVIAHFDGIGADAGVITFPNIHPRWSYARLNGDEVNEVAEKRPVSKNAIAGFYYYKHGKDFIEAGKKVLLKQNNLEGKYYISGSMNELILMNKKIGYYEIAKEQYKSFYSPAKIKEYEESIK